MLIPTSNEPQCQMKSKDVVIATHNEVRTGRIMKSGIHYASTTVNQVFPTLTRLTRWLSICYKCDL